MSRHLLITPDGAAALRSAMRQPVTAEQITAFEARVAAGFSSPTTLKVVDGVAEVAVAGILTEKPDFFAQYFGGGNTTYESIRTSLMLADADPGVKQVVLSISSPGGTVEGLFETLQVLASFSKPLRAQASMACSAAYGIAAQCATIAATTEASSFGSVGVAVSLFVDDTVVDLTNTESPDKRPDAATDEGKAVIQAELDAIFRLFATAIARGRSTTVARVTSDFGRGRTLLADAAKAVGMIDSIVPAPRKGVKKKSADRAESLAELLMTRLPEETSEDYVRRCTSLLEIAGSRAPEAPAPVPHTQAALAAAVAATRSDMPAPFAFELPAGAAAVAAALNDLPGALAVTIDEAEADPEALGLAVERARGLQWDAPRPAAVAK